MTVKVTQSCPTLCDPIDYIICGILQARILEWVAVPFPSRSSQPRDRTQVSCVASEPPGKPKAIIMPTKNRDSPSVCRRIKPLQQLTFNTPWMGLIRNEALCVLGKTSRTGLQIVRYFQEKILWVQSLPLLIPRKALKSHMETSAPRG